MPQGHSPPLRSWLGGASGSRGRHFFAADARIPLSDLVSGSSLGGQLAKFHGRSVLLATSDQLATALALVELDGVARRLILCPPDLAAEHLSHVGTVAEVDAIVSDRDELLSREHDVPLRAICTPTIMPYAGDGPSANRQTEWILLTSGTTGLPKMVVHTLASLTAAIKPSDDAQGKIVWGTFYDIRRYGGLQIFFRSILCGGSLVISSAGEPVGHHLERLAACGMTHLSGTPSHWRRTLMNPSARVISPRYVRLSGEIADQTTLDSLRICYPQAGVCHAYASTEAGVGFEVNDGREGFPPSTIGARNGDIEMKVVDGTLRIRSPCTATRFLGKDAPALLDRDGFVDTGDILELRGDRYYFVGRRGGIINVGGLKVHPEEVEAVINRHPDVHMSLVHSRRNPITGAIVVADVVLRGGATGEAALDRAQQVKREILHACRHELAEHKVPALVRFVSSLDVAPTGKLVRDYA